MDEDRVRKKQEREQETAEEIGRSNEDMVGADDELEDTGELDKDADEEDIEE
jgi:hypothetical protein